MVTRKNNLIFFIAIGSYLFIVGHVWLPSVHYFFDAVAIRDTGTTWYEYGWKDRIGAMLLHIEGPFQYVFINLYYTLIGNILPLNPAVAQFPNTVFAFIGTIYAFLAGKKLFTETEGYLFAISYVLMPWFGMTLRLPWIFNVFTATTQLMTLYYYTLYIQMPDNRSYRIMAPLSLALYLSTGLDWPAFLLVLFVLFVLHKALKKVICNVFSIIPISVFAVYVLWTIYLLYNNGWESARYSIIIYPFLKGSRLHEIDLFSILSNAIKVFGLTFAVSICGLFTARRLLSKNSKINYQQRNIILTMLIWLFITIVPLMINESQHFSYGYVAAIPMAFFATIFLARVNIKIIIPLILLSCLLQWYGIIKDSTMFRYKNDDRRVLAAAAYILEKRPDLLQENKVSFMPSYISANVGQYTRGMNKKIVMPRKYPQQLSVTEVASPAEELFDYVTSYETRDQLKADWFVIASENLSPQLKNASPRSYEFYKKIITDDRISWIAEFENNSNEKIWIGEIANDGTSIKNVPKYCLDEYADLYSAKYDRVKFLRNNVNRVYHY